LIYASKDIKAERGLQPISYYHGHVALA